MDTQSIAACDMLIHYLIPTNDCILAREYRVLACENAEILLELFERNW